jgi:phosphatidylethanolamine-binding protein (PEBP) family uncharacterized protein
VRRRSQGISAVIWLCALALTGCANSGSSTSTQTVADVAFKSSALDRGLIPARFTCDGQDISPPLEWGSVPPSTGSLVLFIVGITPEPSTKSYALSVEWAVAGLKPGLHRLAAGELPRKANVGRNSHGRLHYSICPEKDKDVQYDFELFGLPPSEAVAPDFGGISVYRSLLASGSSPVNAHGRFSASYERR